MDSRAFVGMLDAVLLMVQCAPVQSFGLARGQVTADVEWGVGAGAKCRMHPCRANEAHQIRRQIRGEREGLKQERKGLVGSEN